MLKCLLRLSIIWLFLGVTKPDSLLAQVTTSQDNSQSQLICPAQLAPAIREIVNRPQFQRSRWGIAIQTLDGKETLYALEADKYFVPASNIKLLVSAAALSYLGAQYRIQTPVYAQGSTPNLTSLRIVGQGDPSLSSSQLQDLAQQLQSQGIRRVEQLIVSDNHFREPAINLTWQWEDIIFYYATAVNSLILNENTVTLTLMPQQPGQAVKLSWDDAIAQRQWRVVNQGITAPAKNPYTIQITGFLAQPNLMIQGELATDAKPDSWRLAIPNPPSYFLESLRQILEIEGIDVRRGIEQDFTSPEATETKITTISSPPLAQLLQQANQRSNNIYAEALLYTLGSKFPDLTSAEAVKSILTDLGVDANSYFLADGSGLSRQNLVSPNAITKTLQLMAQIPEAEVYRNSLSLAGVNGTLRRRFRNTAIEGKLWGKTGTLTGVTSLSGYLETNHYQPLVFSIMVNQSELAAKIQRQAIDEVVLLLSQLHHC